jgi:hypothetical protein
MLKSRHSLPAHLAEVLGDALIAIGDGTSAAEALGLSLKPGKEKTYGVRYAKIIEYLVSDLCRQGMSRDDAWSRVARLNRERGEFINDPDKKAVDRLKRRLKRGRTK